MIVVSGPFKAVPNDTIHNWPTLSHSVKIVSYRRNSSHLLDEFLLGGNL